MSVPPASDKTPIRAGWLLSMAWRDSRTYRRRLLLYMSSIILGTAALVSIRTLGDSMAAAIDVEAKALLGADLDINTRTAFSDSAEIFLGNLGGEQSRQSSFVSMVSFPRTGSSRLSSVRALEGGFPYYGVLETVPPAAAQAFKTDGTALVDDNLMIQHGVEVGDSIRVGDEHPRDLRPPGQHTGRNRGHEHDRPPGLHPHVGARFHGVDPAGQPRDLPGFVSI